MHISKFRIQNYKSFLDSGEVKLGEGINIITGQNNAGKTALLQALSSRFHAHQHRSSRTIPSAISKITGESNTTIEFKISRENIMTYIFDHLTHFHLPQIKDVGAQMLNGKQFFERYIKAENTLIAIIAPEGQIRSVVLNSINFINNGACLGFLVNKNTQELTYNGINQTESSLITITRFICSRIYSFQAERLNIGHCDFGNDPVLASNASNLPEVLNILQGDKMRFERYNSFVRKIFPQIFQISTRPVGSNLVQIVVWNEDPIFERSDLVVPLSECGTGLGQALAILYAVLTSDVSHVIIIDEPNSFLHPGASRKLVEILKDHPQHQFIITTHSPSTIAASNPKTINILRYANAQSTVERVNVLEVNKQQVYLAEIGSKLSDVFGADNILWVEGKTEEVCIPKIIEATQGIALMGTTVLSVIHTGDFQKKKGQHAELIFSIYDRLSKGKGLLPAAIGFLFDSEGLTKNEQDDLKRKSNNGVRFTSRKMFENYLLNPKAIYSVINHVDNNLTSEITPQQIEKWFESNKWDAKLIPSRFKSEADWPVHVHGAKLLEKLFSDLTAQTLAFDKIKHSVALCEWIIENSSDDLSELQVILKDILK